MVIVYKCKISQSEMFDDEEPVTELFNGQVLKIPSKKIQDEAEEDECLVNSVVNNFRYTQTEMSKKDFIAYFKAYAKNLMEKLQAEGINDEEMALFKKESQNFFKFINEKFDNAEFYLSEFGVNFDAATLGIGVWDDECTEGPNFYYLAQSLKKTKM